MLQTYDSSTKANSTVQIITGIIKEVQADTVLVTVPAGYNNTKEFTIRTESLTLPSAPVAGMPFAAIGLDCDDGTFEVNAEKQKAIAARATQFIEFERCKTNVTTKKKSMEHDVFMMFPVRKSSQVQIDETKGCVKIPANIDNITVWLSFYAGKFNHFEDYTKGDSGKKALGMKTYAEMLRKKLDGLAEDEVLMISYSGRFEDAVKDEASGKTAYSPAVPKEKDGRLVYNVFGNGEAALGTMLNTAVAIPKSFLYEKEKEGLASGNGAETKPGVAREGAADPQEPEESLSEEEEMATLQQAMGV